MSVLEQWGLKCPKCGEDHTIDIAATISVRLSEDGTDPDEARDRSHEWDENSGASCGCGFCGKVADFSQKAACTQQVVEPNAMFLCYGCNDPIHGPVKWLYRDPHSGSHFPQVGPVLDVEEAVKPFHEVCADKLCGKATKH